MQTMRGNRRHSTWLTWHADQHWLAMRPPPGSDALGQLSPLTDHLAPSVVAGWPWRLVD